MKLSCDGCKNKGKYESEVEMGYNSPCTKCQRRCQDNYEANHMQKLKECLEKLNVDFDNDADYICINFDEGSIYVYFDEYGNFNSFEI